MLGKHHVVVGAGVGVTVVTLDHGPALFAKGLEAVHPFEVLNVPHGFVQAIPNLAPSALGAVALPAWFSLALGFVLAYGVGIFFSAGLALLPDIDSHASTFGEFFPEWARYLTHMKHRGETHWLVTGLLVGGLVGVCTSGSPMGSFFVHLTLGGYLIGHLLCDLITTEGLVLLGPFVRTRFRLPLLAFDTGGRVEPLVAYGLAAMLALWGTGILGHFAMAISARPA